MDCHDDLIVVGNYSWQLERELQRSSNLSGWRLSGDLHAPRPDINRTYCARNNKKKTKDAHYSED
jgi:hypothetical protein